MGTPDTSMYYMDEQDIGNSYLLESSIPPPFPGMMDLPAFPEYERIISQMSQGDFSDNFINSFPQNMNLLDTSALYQPFLQ
jgi:hypothetical protein